MARDFSDGVLYADILSYYFPKLVKNFSFEVKYSTESKIS